MALNYVTLILDGFDGGGNALGQGAATFAPSVQLTDPVDQEWIPPVPVQGLFRAGLAAPQVTLLATDNANVHPNGWGWTVAFQNILGNPAGFTFFLPFSSGATQRLSQLQPVSSVVTMQAYMPLSGGSFTGGVAPSVAVLTDGATIPVSANQGNLFRVTLAGNHQLANPTGGLDGQMIRIEVSPGGHTLSYGTQYNFGDAGQPALNGAKRNTLGFAYNASIPSWDFLGAGTGF